MISYQEYEKAVYEWLMAKHSVDPSFTFSTRVNGMKGSELDYFIGTEKSGYFGLTFWTIPVGFPGSASDLIDVFFEQKEDGFKFFFEFGQTMTPHDAQNASALNLIRNVKEKIRGVGAFTYETTEDLKMFKYALGSPKPRYTSLEDLFVDLNIILNSILPLIEEGIKEEKKLNPDFNAQRITPKQFDEIQEKLDKRFIKYEHINEFDNDTKESFEIFLKRFEVEDLKIYFDFLKEIALRFELKPNDERLVFNVHSRRGHLSFTVGQRYCFMLSNNEKQGKFGFLSKDKLFENSEQFEGNHPRPWFTYMNVFNLDEEQKQNVFDGIEVELNRSPKSGFRKFNKPEFEAFVMGNDVIPEKKELISTVMKHPLNQILYGPPGTGKTFKLKDNYFPMYTTKETSLSSEQHFKNVVSECSWWQVIAIALIQTGKTKVSDLANHKWVLQKAQLSNSSTLRPTIWGQLQSHTVDECEFVNVKAKQQPFIFNKTQDSYWEILDEEVKEKVPELYDIIDSVENFNPSSDKEIQRYVFTTFHQSYSYEDFIEGIKPIMIDGEEDGNVAYHIEDGVFKQLCKKAEIDPENRYAIFIDEINRGNVSQIFGELITLIEQDKRKGAANAMSALLPYSKKQFSVPQNVDVYGTMNTADRSVEALDTALRRRFSFEEMLPQPALLKDKGEKGSGKVGEIDLEELLSTINERIEALVDRDHTIGHAFFMEVDSPDSLRNVFANKVIPLLQEYFYGDYAKMEMVIGPDFFNGEKRKKKVIFAIQNEDIEIPTGNYELMNILDPTFNFDSAINRLLNRKVIEVEAN